MFPIQIHSIVTVGNYKTYDFAGELRDQSRSCALAKCARIAVVVLYGNEDLFSGFVGGDDDLDSFRLRQVVQLNCAIAGPAADSRLRGRMAYVRVLVPGN